MEGNEKTSTSAPELLLVGEGVRLEACQADEYIRKQREEIKLDDTEQSNAEEIRGITNIEADSKYCGNNALPCSKVKKIDEKIALKGLARVSNLLPQFEKSKIVDESPNTNIRRISAISENFLDHRKAFEKTSASAPELLPVGEGVRLEACQADEYIRKQREEIKLDDTEQSNVEEIRGITNIEADSKYCGNNALPRSKVKKINEKIALKDLARVSNLLPQFEKSKIVDESPNSNIRRISAISENFLDHRKAIGENLFRENNFLTLQDVCTSCMPNGMGIEKNIQNYIENEFLENLQSGIHQMSGGFVDNDDTITVVTTRNNEPDFDDECELILDYKEFEKGVNVKDTIWQMARHDEEQEFSNNYKESKELSLQKASHAIELNPNTEKSINTEIVEEEYENYPETKFILTGEETKLKERGEVEQKIVHHKISPGVITERQEKFVLDKIKSLESENFAEQVEEKLDQCEKSSKIIHVTVRKGGSSEEKSDLHEISSKIDQANKAAKRYVTESSEAEIAHMSEIEIPKDVKKILDDINFITLPYKSSYINEAAKDVMKVSLEIPTTETIPPAIETIKSELSNKDIMNEIAEFAKHSTPAKNPVCVESTISLKADTNQTPFSEQVSLQATNSRAIGVNESKSCTNLVKKPTIVKGKMEIVAKKDEKNVISCRPKTTLNQNKHTKFPLITSRKVGKSSGTHAFQKQTAAIKACSSRTDTASKTPAGGISASSSSTKIPNTATKCSSRELKPAVKIVPAKYGDPSSKIEDKQKPLGSSKTHAFQKQTGAAKACSSSTATASQTPADGISASSSSTKMPNTAVIKNRQRNFPKDSKETKLVKPKWR